MSQKGLKRSLIALIGFRNSPAHFQRFIDRLLRKYNKYYKTFINNVIIFSNSFSKYIQQLHTIFKLFNNKNIKVSLKKSFLGYPNVDLLGFKINGFGLIIITKRVKAFRKLKFPRQLKALKTYINSTSFLKYLIPYYA